MSVESARRAHLRFEVKERAATATERWPCRQCGALIGWTTRGGNRRTLCVTCAPDERFRSLVQRYGVDKIMFDAMYFEQDGRCALAPCIREAKAVDHSHENGKVRGLLCQGCNIALGFVENDQWMDSVREYLH